MSILDALKVQKANQQSVSELAALPQNEIIRLAQMGQIPADVVPVVINEKARMAQEWLTCVHPNKCSSKAAKCRP
jgi:hypothetical protein